MPAREKKVTGRPSKGDRHLMVTRVPRPVADFVIQQAEASGASYSEYIAAVLSAYAGRPDLAPIPQPRNESELPMTG